MQARRLKRIDLARELGLTHPAISNYLHGRTPTAEVLQKMAAFFGTSVDYLLTGVAGEISLDYEQDFDQGERKFPERLKWLRRKLGLSVADFEKQAGDFPDYVRRIESGRAPLTRPSDRFIQALRAKLGVRPQWLQYGFEVPFEFGNRESSVDNTSAEKLNDEWREQNRFDLFVEDLAGRLSTVELTHLITRTVEAGESDLKQRMAQILTRMLSTRLAAGDEPTDCLSLNEFLRIVGARWPKIRTTKEKRTKGKSP